MKTSIALAAIAALAFAAAAQAHTHLKSSSPAEGSSITASPANIVLKFSEAARVTALSVQKDGGPEQKLAPLPAKAAAEVSVPAPSLVAGKYVVNYRVVSDDGHVMSGTLHFTIDPSAPPSAGKAPDHAHGHEHESH
jgi:methionine-rich copper-binding protein CopC